MSQNHLSQSDYLTVEYAKSKIAETQSVLELTTESRLSSPGRLHDLFVTLEAMSPDEFKSGAIGSKIRYGLHQTPFGNCLIATTARGICLLHFCEDANERSAEQQLSAEWKNAEIICDRDATVELCDRLFQPPTPLNNRPHIRRVPIALSVKGTNFQIQVWRALLNIPFGGMTTYQGLANLIGKPTAARAVGNAVGQNPIGYLIPCHRVLRASGKLGGYRWGGAARKAAILGWESGQAEQFKNPSDNFADDFDEALDEALNEYPAKRPSESAVKIGNELVFNNVHARTFL